MRMVATFEHLCERGKENHTQKDDVDSDAQHAPYEFYIIPTCEVFR